MPAVCIPSMQAASMTTMIGKTTVKTSYRAAASVIAIAIASLTVPSLAQAKRMGSSKSVRPASIGSKAFFNTAFFRAMKVTAPRGE